MADETQSLTAPQWRHRIDALLRGEARPDLPYGRDDEPHHYVERLGASLSGEAYEGFREGITQLLQSTPPSQKNAERIYQLLYLVSAFTPPSAHETIWRLLRDETLIDLRYEPYHLHSMAISALGDYAADPDAVEYVQAACPKVEDFRVLLAGFRLLARAGKADVAFGFLRHLVPRLKQDATYAEQIAYLLLGLMGTLPYAGLFRFLQRSDAILRVDFPDEWRSFRESLMTVLLDWDSIDADEPDGYVWLCSGWLHAGRYPFTAREIFEFARRALLVQAEKETRATLIRIRERSVKEGLHTEWRFSEDRRRPGVAYLQVSRADSGRHDFDEEKFREEANLLADAMLAPTFSLSQEEFEASASVDETLDKHLYRLAGYVN